MDASFWERYSTPVRQLEATTEKTEEAKEETKVEETKSSSIPQLEVKSEETEEAKEETNVEESKTDEIEDIWAGRDEDDIVIKKPVTSLWSTYSKPEETESSCAVKETEEVVDIWADRVEDLPPIKPLKTKLKSLETAKESFWSTVSKATVETPIETETKIEKPLPKAEFINRIEFKVKLHTFSLKEAEAKPQNATVHYEEEQIVEEELEPQQEEEEVDFWAQIEKSKESKEPEPKIIVKEPLYYNTFGEQETSYNSAMEEQQASSTVAETSYNYAQEEEQTPVAELSYNYQQEEQQVVHCFVAADAVAAAVVPQQLLLNEIDWA